MRILKNYPYVPYNHELTERRADAKQAMQPWDFVAFTGKTVPEVGMSLRFYGGSAATSITPCAPTLAFDIFGDCELIVGEWMNEENCPNAFDARFVSKVSQFVQENLPILCLVHFGYLTCTDAMDYFCGRDEWDIMLTGIQNIPDETYLWLQYAKNPHDLHLRAFEAGLYGYMNKKMTFEEFAEKLCLQLRNISIPLFESDMWSDEWYLVKYNGHSPCVSIPEDVAIIGDEAFMGHAELRQVKLHNGCYGIGAKAFAGCANLVGINLPENCDWIGSKAFAECTSLKYLALPPKVCLEEGAFQHCTALQEIVIPEDVQSIETDVFLGCENLIVRCRENSCAHYYAQEHGIRFELQE